jgi:dynein heavy chain, axonemal
LRRKIYITPKSYIDLLSAYKRLLKRKHDELNDSKSKLSNGLYKLKEANELIEGLKEKLTLL